MESFLTVRAVIAAAVVAGVLALAPLGCAGDPAFVGDSSSAGGAGGSSSSGGAPCQTPEDCAGDETECVRRTCTAGICGLDYSTDGFLVGAQAAGDCQKTVCDGKGGIATVPDDSDKPSDGNDCTGDVCQAGTPSHPPTPMGTACGATQKLTCDGAGSCTGCMTGADCGANAPCVSYACEATACKITYVASGKGDPGNQKAGDCKKNVCNGAGGVATVNNGSDVPNDGNPCTQDLCSMGQPSHSPAPAGTTCGGSSKCDGNGTCVGCLVDSDCGQGAGCTGYVCQASSCKSVTSPDGTGCDDGVDCTSNDACSGGSCAGGPAPLGTSCSGGGICDGAQTCCNGNYGSLGMTQISSGVVVGTYNFHDVWCDIGPGGSPPSCYAGVYIYSQSLTSESCLMPGSGGLCTDPDAQWNVECAMTVRCKYDCQGSCGVDPCM